MNLEEALDNELREVVFSLSEAVYDERYSSRCYQDQIHALEMKLHSLLSVYKNSNTALPELNYYLGFKVDVDWYMEKV